MAPAAPAPTASASSIPQLKSADEFKKTVGSAAPVLVEFFGRRCQVCTNFEPTVEGLSKKYPQIKFYRVCLYPDFFSFLKVGFLELYIHTCKR